MGGAVDDATNRDGIDTLDEVDEILADRRCVDAEQASRFRVDVLHIVSAIHHHDPTWESVENTLLVTDRTERVRLL